MRIDPKSSLPRFKRLAHLEGLAVAGEDHPKFVERRVVNDGFEIGPFRERASNLCAIVVDDDRAARVDDGGKADVVAVNARFKNRAESLILAQREVRIHVTRDDSSGAMEDRVGQHLSARQAFPQHHVGQTIRVERTERHDRQSNDGCHADDLFDANAQAHRSKVKGHII